LFQLQAKSEYHLRYRYESRSTLCQDPAHSAEQVYGVRFIELDLRAYDVEPQADCTSFFPDHRDDPGRAQARQGIVVNRNPPGNEARAGQRYSLINVNPQEGRRDL
jgi:hypothetical protein